MAGNADSAAQGTCSATHAPGATAQGCPLHRIVDVRWEKDESWCSEGGPIAGRTDHYANAETIDVAVKDHADASAVTTLRGQVSSNAFRSPWDVVEVLPVGGPSWHDQREMDGEAGGVTTARTMAVRFIPNVPRGRKRHTTEYDRTEPGAAAAHKVGVDCHFELEAANYLLTIYGVLKYVRGRARERLLLNNAALTGGFTLFGATNHWGYRDHVTGGFRYWDGSAWQNTPAGWIPNNSNHFGIPFYKSGSTWVCRDVSRSWPEPLTDWPAGTSPDATLSTWKTNIETVWTDKFDIKRKGCRSTRAECCRYKTRCVANFRGVDSFNPDETIIVVNDDVRSDSGMWSIADTRYGLAPHEFGHLLGAPDEYGGVPTTQLGVNDTDGLVDGVDDNCIMGQNLSDVKRRHYKGICEVFALLVKDESGKTYTYEAIAKAANLASPPGTALAPSTMSRAKQGSILIGAIVGGIVGAVVGAIVGFIASGGNPAGAVAGALLGGALGALVGAGLGALF